MEAMSPATRKKLVHMACVAAWSDLDIAEEERRVVLEFATAAELDPADIAEVKGWLDAPPPEFDPYDIPHAHRMDFLEALAAVMKADGRLDPAECETFALIEELVA